MRILMQKLFVCAGLGLMALSLSVTIPAITKAESSGCPGNVCTVNNVCKAEGCDGCDTNNICCTADNPFCTTN